MSDDIYDDAFGTETEGMKRERMEMTVDIYESADHVRDYDFKTETNTHKPLQRTGSDSAKSRSSRAAVVCLVLLCVLLLTAVKVLCVHIHTNNTNYTEETKQLLTNDTNLTEEGDQDELIIKNANLLNKTDQLINQLSILGKEAEWIYYQSSFYYMSNKTKNWTEGRRDCEKKGADLIIINNNEEQDFVTKITDKREFWIGVTDSDVEKTWKWVDGSTLTTGFWASGADITEPNGGTAENCAVTYLKQKHDVSGWHDVKCNDAYQWICEKSILPLIRNMDFFYGVTQV
ncbi:CD209 antigen-like protein C [Sinocyclocheilus grahami]|uniref:CD209 antigen-like protein C n=1 Tax=Sinocyclocheilus grahami TaxID=75366 RepID=UPI0007AC555C|nr:PREDICTED: CD209 antigen-like protein C [Sinocyclocheilus grahami]